MNKTRAKEIFERYDDDEDGFIERDEFIKMMFEIFKVKKETEKEKLKKILDDIYTLVDGRGLFNKKDDQLNLSEFKIVASLIPDDYENPFKAIAYILFRLVDTNNSGSINEKELANYFNQKGVEYKSDEIKNLIKKFDTNENKKLEFWEFLKMFE